jgi:hypothetical protein
LTFPQEHAAKIIVGPWRYRLQLHGLGQMVLGGIKIVSLGIGIT